MATSVTENGAVNVNSPQGTEAPRGLSKILPYVVSVRLASHLVKRRRVGVLVCNEDSGVWLASRTKGWHASCPLSMVLLSVGWFIHNARTVILDHGNLTLYRHEGPRKRKKAPSRVQRGSMRVNYHPYPCSSGPIVPSGFISFQHQKFETLPFDRN